MFALLSGGGIATIIWVAPKYNSFNWYALTVFVTVFEMFIYLMTALKNPGIVPPNPLMKEDLERANNPKIK